MISADAQGRITLDAFVQRYTAITQQATITKVSAALAAGQRSDANIQQFAVTFETEQNTITLGVDPTGREWKVQWLPSLFFKELTADNLIHMYPLRTPRGDIKDNAGNPLATVGQVTTVYLVPGEIKDEATMLAQLSRLLNTPQAVIKQQYAQAETNARGASQNPFPCRRRADPGAVGRHPGGACAGRAGPRLPARRAGRPDHRLHLPGQPDRPANAGRPRLPPGRRDRARRHRAVGGIRSRRPVGRQTHGHHAQVRPGDDDRPARAEQSRQHIPDP